MIGTLDLYGGIWNDMECTWTRCVVRVLNDLFCMSLNYFLSEAYEWTEK